jgi:hypothetical protein
MTVSGDALTALAAKWRRQAEPRDGLKHVLYVVGWDAAKRQCADELAALIAAGLSEAPAPQVCEWIADSEGSNLYTTSCKEDFVALEGCELDFVKFCCYCGKVAQIFADPALASPAPPKEPSR